MAIDVVTLSLAKNYADSKGGGSGASSASGISYSNSELEGVTNVQQGLDALVEDKHSHANKEILDKFSVSGNELLFDGKSIDERKVFYIDGVLGWDDENSEYTFTTEVTVAAMVEAYKKNCFLIIRIIEGEGQDLVYQYAACVLAHIALDNSNCIFKFTILSGGSQYDFDYEDSIWKVTEINFALDKDYIELTAPTTLSIDGNTDYRLTNVSSLTIDYSAHSPGSENWMKLTLAETGPITVTISPSPKYIGEAPTFKNGETWELSFRDGVVAAAKVGGDGGSSSSNEKEIFQISTTVTKTGDDYNIISSVTAEEITNAYNSGKQLVCIANLSGDAGAGSYIVPLAYAETDDVFYFSTLVSGTTVTIGFSAAATENQWSIEIAEASLDKTEIVNAVLAALPTWTGGSY